MCVGTRVHALRCEARLTLRDLSFPGCSPAYLSLIERGRRMPSLQVLVELARRLGVSADFLGYGEERSNGGGAADDAAWPDGSRVIAHLQHALDEAKTWEDAAWLLATVAQVALLRGDRVRAVSALRQTLVLLGDVDRRTDENRGARPSSERGGPPLGPTGKAEALSGLRPVFVDECAGRAGWKTVSGDFAPALEARDYRHFCPPSLTPWLS
jgi:transcriptional regulator with XRE-family HTH domain